MRPVHEKLILDLLRSFLWFRVAVLIITGFTGYFYGKNECTKALDRDAVATITQCDDVVGRCMERAIRKGK